MHGTFDFETYSEAGFIWNPASQSWDAPPGARRKGLFAVGAPAYSEHPSTEVLTLTYALPGGVRRRWRPGEPLPQELFDHLAAGGAMEAHNAMFEWLIWNNVCVPKYGFPRFSQYQLRCSMAKAHVNGFPGALADLSKVLRLPTPKDADGKRLLDKFSVPRKPTKANPALRIRPEDDPAHFERLRAYCDTDVIAEEQASERTAPLTAAEMLFWFVDQEINYRGIAVDRPAIRDCIVILEQALARYGDECREITGGINPTQLEALRGWLAAHGAFMVSMDEETVAAALEDCAHWPADCRRVLELRQLIGSASVKKLYAMENQACRDDRLRDLMIHHGARTGRPTGGGPQPLNLPRAGPDLRWCEACSHPFRHDAAHCPWCAAPAPAKRSKWSAAAVDHVLEIMATRDLSVLEYYFGDALLCISGCLRGLFVAGPGMELIASDYSSIEAVVLAMLAGEQWRIDAFCENKPIYLLSASKITGIPLEEYLAYYEAHGDHHPDRQKIGKVNELANGFGGWIGSSRAFGSDEPDDVVRARILAWRAASPAIVEFWGGQWRGPPWADAWEAPNDLYGVEGMAIAAIQNPGLVFEFRGLRFYIRADGALMITLPSGRELTYNQAQATRSVNRWGRESVTITYMTHNSNPKYGALGWVPMDTYGGRLTENIVQAVAHDILRHAILALRAAGYPCVLHVYDEVICEVPAGAGSIEQFEAIMSEMPAWAQGWPVRAAGGWRGRRYRKG